MATFYFTLLGGGGGLQPKKTEKKFTNLKFAEVFIFFAFLWFFVVLYRFLRSELRQ